MSTPVQVKSISKSFGTNQVLRGISLDIHPGEIVSLMGANGAGKSTLIKILSGAYPEFEGEIWIEGEAVHIGSPLEARARGVETVHQKIDDGIISGLSVAENLLFDRIGLNLIPTFCSTKRMVKLAREVAQSLDLQWSDAELRADVYQLGIADKQMLLLARALSTKPKLLILDEPTSALSDKETERLFAVIKKLRAQGVAILYVSHRLGEIDELADRIFVLRDGLIQNEQTPPFKWDAALHAMLGAEVARELQQHEEHRGSKEILRADGVQLFTESAPFSVEVRSGEVTGVIGLLGSGKSEFARAIFGAEPLINGTFTLEGKKYRPNSPTEAVAHGVYLVSEDRALDGLLEGWNISRTASLPFLKKIASQGLLNFRTESELGTELISKLGVVAQSQSSTVESLSGGNQQKVMVGRWLIQDPKLLLLDEPFRGVDIGARREISRQIGNLAAAGNAALVFSADIDEILEVADRIFVFVEGELRFETYLSNTTRSEIIQKMSEVA